MRPLDRLGLCWSGQYNFSQPSSMWAVDRIALCVEEHPTQAGDEGLRFWVRTEENGNVSYLHLATKTRLSLSGQGFAPHIGLCEIRDGDPRTAIAKIGIGSFQLELEFAGGGSYGCQMPSADPPGSSLLALPDPLSPVNFSLLLDFDGTLVDLVDRPDAVVADPPLLTLLHRLAGTFDGRTALVSGRSVDQLLGFFEQSLARFSFVGSHGAEFQIGSKRVAPVRSSTLEEVERAMQLAFGKHEGIIVESKSLGVALHFRLAPEAEANIRAFATDMAEATGLVIQEGKMMIELRSPGYDKGTGIVNLMSHSPFFGTLPIFIGDDITDEAGFAAAERLGGFGVLVGAARPTVARYRLENVAAVREWLGEAT